MKRIFISYKRVNKDKVYQLVKQIEGKLGVSCWVDLEGIESSAQFASKMCTAIDNAEVVLFMHSSAHLNVDFDNDWTIKELNYAHLTKKRVVLVKLDEAPLRNVFLMEYGSKNNIDSNEPDQVEKMIDDLSKWLRLQSDSKVKAKASDSHGRVWHVGDYYDLDGKEGVVYWVDETGKHGRILSVDQVKLPWCVYKEFNKQLLTGTTSKNNGLMNLQTIEKISGWKDKYPAFAWCAEHGNGWYLPAIDELNDFLASYNVFSRVNVTLKRLFSPLLKRNNGMSSDKYYAYWSSTEFGNVQAYIMEDDPDKQIWNPKGFRHESLYVRAVCRF